MGILEKSPTKKRMDKRTIQSLDRQQLESAYLDLWSATEELEEQVANPGGLTEFLQNALAEMFAKQGMLARQLECTQKAKDQLEWQSKLLMYAAAYNAAETLKSLDQDSSQWPALVAHWLAPAFEMHTMPTMCPNKVEVCTQPIIEEAYRIHQAKGVDLKAVKESLERRLGC